MKESGISESISHWPLENTLSPENIPALVDSLPQAMALLNKEREIVFANKSFHELAKTAENGLIGMRPGQAIDCENASKTSGGCGTAFECKSCGALASVLTAFEGKESEKECRLLAKNNRAFDLSVRAMPLRLEDDFYVLCQLIDISHEKRRRMLERVFLHDLANTTGALLGFSQLVQTPDPKDSAEVLQEIQKISHKILDEIRAQEEILEAENEEIRITREAVEARDVLTEAVEFLLGHEISKERNLSLRIPPTSVCLFTDRGLLYRVLSNLLKNAFEATSKGESVVAGYEESSGAVRFFIHNSEAISDENKTQIFRRSFSTKGQGRGIGTFGAKLLTERYLDGKIWFETAKNSGTTFFVELPLG